MGTYVQNGLNALGDPTRLTIFEMLGASPRAVNELAKRVPVSRPAVSQHLRVLKDARLVRDRREGTRRIYELDSEGLAMLRDHFAQLWRRALLPFREFAEEEYVEEKNYERRNRGNGRLQKKHVRKRSD